MSSAVQRKRPIRKILLWGFLLLPILYVSTCSYFSQRKTRGFEAINVGDAEGEVIRLLGKPSLREKAGDRPFGRYSSYACVLPCSERLWYENPLAFVGEAWSVELDKDQRVIKTIRWVSP